MVANIAPVGLNSDPKARNKIDRIANRTRKQFALLRGFRGDRNRTDE